MTKGVAGMTKELNVILEGTNTVILEILYRESTIYDILEGTTTVILKILYRESRPIFLQVILKKISLQIKIQTHSFRMIGDSCYY
jgi:hypothetical protein